MSDSWLIMAAIMFWLVGAVLALLGFGRAARAALALGCAGFIALAVYALPAGLPQLHVPLGMPEAPARLHLGATALWLFGFGLVPAFFAAWIGSPVARPKGARWAFGLAMSLIGALGVFGLQDAVTFLVAWEVMSLGGALMILGERLSSDNGRAALFMLALLEAGTIALMLALVLLSTAAGSLDFATFPAAAAKMPVGEQVAVGLLLLVGFGAKIGLLPFYEWFPAAYGSGSGATGTLLSGVVLNAAYFGLARGLLVWLPAPAGLPVSPVGIVIVILAVASAILTILYAFQQDGWRELLSLSTAENGAIAMSVLGMALMFRQDGLADLAGLGFAVGLIHLAGHTLAKGTLMLVADAVYRVSGSYDLVQSGFAKRLPLAFGVGALFAAMSLAAMPPVAGFVSEWYVFQTVFQGFHMASLASRLTAAMAGAGLALTAAIALATFIKAYGIGLLGDGTAPAQPGGVAAAAAGNDKRNGGGTGRIVVAVGVLGTLVLVLAVGMPLWLGALGQAVASATGTNAPALMRNGWDLVPLSASFAFISPSKLVIVMPLLALLPVFLLLIARKAVRRAPVWYGGHLPLPGEAATTALTFSNALRTFYSFVYRPVARVDRESAPDSNGHPYFIRRLSFRHDVAPVFGPYLFAPLERGVLAFSAWVRWLQSGHLNVYLAIVGLLLILILAAVFFV